MSKQANVIEWKDTQGATIEDEPREDIKCISCFVVGGVVAHPGQVVKSVPLHMARNLRLRGRAQSIES